MACVVSKGCLCYNAAREHCGINSQNVERNRQAEALRNMTALVNRQPPEIVEQVLSQRKRLLAILSAWWLLLAMVAADLTTQSDGVSALASKCEVGAA